MSANANNDTRSKGELLAEIGELRARLDEAEQTLEAIRSGDVDALIVSGPDGDRIFSLTGAERTYRLIVETMNEAALTVDPDKTILFCNQRFCDLVKRPMADIIGQKLTAFVGAAQRQSLRTFLGDAQIGPIQRRLTLRDADGAAVSVLLAASLLADDSNTSICLVASNLTELEAQASSIRVLREQQQALEESRAELQIANTSLRDSRRAVLSVAEDAIAARRQAEETSVELRREIAERIRAEEELRHSEEHFRTLAESIPNMAWWANGDGYITWYNRRWYEYTGTTPAQMEGWGWQGVHDPLVLPKVLEKWKASIVTGEPFEMEFPLRGADGIFRTFLTRVLPLKDSNGCVFRWFGTNTDISALKESEAALKKLNEELENRVAQRTAELREKDQMLLLQSRQAAMGEMIGNIAHQWRQPLNALGFAIQQILLFYELGELSRDILDQSIRTSMELIQHMSKTIDDFRNYFKPDKEKAEFKVNEAITNTVSLIEDSFKYQHIGIEVVAKDDASILGFRNEFAQALLNILNNARDALIERKTGNPRVTITISSEGDRTVITVCDNAGGIPDEIMGKIFDPYFSTKGPQAGTGIGLFMSKAIIEKNMGGRLVARNAGKGAEFRIEV